MTRILSISTAAFDGYDLPIALREISQLGVDYVELAYIQGYTDPFGEEVFSPDNTRRVADLLAEIGISCFALSAHMDLASEKATDIFQKRMEFAHRIGAKVVISNAAPKHRRDAFLRNIETLAVIARSLDLTLGLENPGDGKPNLLDTGKDGATLIGEIGSASVRLNYDFGNLISHCFEKVRPEEDWKFALPYSAHLHIKDVMAYEEGWHFTEIGKGSIGYGAILGELRSSDESLPVSLEIPLRVTRAPDASPRRASSPISLDEIRRVLRGSHNFVRGILEQKG